MTAVAVSLVGALGLAIGSFLNVVVYRVPAGLSVVRPASACPQCGHEIRGRDNVPVLSWLLLRGRCRDCRTAISARYPAVEALTGLAFVLVGLWAVPGILAAGSPLAVASGVVALLGWLYLAAISVALAAIDLDTRRLPDAIVLPSYLVVGVLFTAAALLGGETERLLPMGVGALASVAFYLVLALIYPGGMGMGDVKLAGVLGLALGYAGWPALIVGVASAFVLGGVVGLVVLAVRRARERAIPFGPWMFAGAWIGIVAGASIAAGYLELAGLA